MPQEFEIRREVAVEATPEQVWQAIADGPGIDSWFMGRTELEPGVGGKVRQTFPGGFTEEAEITAWQPGSRLAYRGAPSPEGAFMAFEYLVEGRGSGTTVVRLVHSGFLGDDWESEYEALEIGDLQYLRKLATYVRYFGGRHSTHNLFLVHPEVGAAAFRSEIGRVLGLAGEARAGDEVTVAVEGLEPEPGVVEWTDAGGGCVGVRTGDALYLFFHAQGNAVVERHVYVPADGAAVERAWQGWLDRAFA
ncbi:SRPBCC domain-containing protein [Nonomuraea pusilla]|uniref:SRPBCC family protein n=1 Tax=Nonomuraea pusilla TaxID=46177 RepID=UPI003318F746